MRNYQTKSNQGALPDSITSTRFGAGEFNSVAAELEGAVTTSGQTLAPADGTGEVTDQLAMALAIYGAGGAAYHVDTGAVNAYVLTPVSPKESPNAYFNGFSVVFEPGTINTTASTVNVGGLGVKSITLQNGTALTGGELSGTCCLKYNLSDDRFELIYSSDSALKISQYYEIDATQSDQGATSTNPNTMTIYDVATLVGTSKFATVHLAHNPNAGNQTYYTFDTSLDLTSYPFLFFDFDAGAIINRTTGDEILTMFSPENIKAQPNQQIFNADMISFAYGGTIQAGWWGIYVAAADNGTPLQYAINSNNNSYPCRITMPAGSYSSTVTVNIEVGAYSIFDLAGVQWNKTNIGDAFTINNGQTTTPDSSQFIFGKITHINGSAIRSYGQFKDSYITWQEIIGTSRGGYGLYLDADTVDGGAAQSVLTIDVGFVYDEQYGIFLSSDTNIDTCIFNTKHGFLYNNDIAVYVRSRSTGNQINTNKWKLNLDASVTGSDIAIKTNEKHSQFDLILGGIGSHNIELGSYDGHSAQECDFTRCRPRVLSFGSPYLIDSSGNNTNEYPRIGIAPITITVGSSPFTYQNPYYQDMMVAITGGAASTVQLSSDGVTFYQVYGGTDTTFLLPKKHYMLLNYTVAPAAKGYLF